MDDITAVLDACVLYPAPIRDLFMNLAVFDAFRARWTEEIHDEWIRNVLKDRPDLSPEQLERTRKLMNTHVRDCLVEDYGGLIDRVELPDADDRHVLAAAIKTEADHIVTFNLRDFPSEILGPYGLQATHPDEFIMLLIDRDTELVRQAALTQWRSLKNPPVSLNKFLEKLKENKLDNAVRRLRKLFYELDEIRT